jgi:hypothetical protein
MLLSAVVAKRQVTGVPSGSVEPMLNVRTPAVCSWMIAGTCPIGLPMLGCARSTFACTRKLWSPALIRFEVRQQLVNEAVYCPAEG